MNARDFDLPRLSRDRARPIAATKYVFVSLSGKLAALDAKSGELVREFPGIGQPREVIHERDTVVVVHDGGVAAFSAETGKDLWRFDAEEARNVIAGNDRVSLIQGRPKRGEKSEAVTVDLYTGDVLWRTNGFKWLDAVTRTVMHGDQIAYETSSFSDSDAGNAIYIVSAEDGKFAWQKDFAPGMNHKRQGAGDVSRRQDLDSAWRSPQLRGQGEPVAGRHRSLGAGSEDRGGYRDPIQRAWRTAFRPWRRRSSMMAGVLDMTDLESGEIIANRITKANCVD